LAEAVVNTIKRDYVGGADLSDAATVNPAAASVAR
jgi:hypothetical protein